MNNVIVVLGSHLHVSFVFVRLVVNLPSIGGYLTLVSLQTERTLPFILLTHKMVEIRYHQTKLVKANRCYTHLPEENL